MTRARLLIASAALAALALPAFAQSSYGGAQVSLDDTFGGLTISVDEADDVGGTAVASGNSMTAIGSHDFSVTGSQSNTGATTAMSDADVTRAWGNVATGAVATSNGVTAQSTGGDVLIAGSQTTMGGTGARATANIGNAWSAATSAAAGGNVIAADVENGDLTIRAAQESGADTEAEVEANVCCVATTATAATVASANNINVSGYTTTLQTATTQVSYGERTRARTDLYVGYAGDAVGNATANGNAITLTNQWGYVNAAATQENWSNTTAESYVTLGGDWIGFASASAYGVGNAATFSNVGSDTVLATDQANNGAVGAYAALAGGEGGDALASSAAYGNSVTGGLCNSCTSAGAMTASNTQTNAGPVRSETTVRAHRAGSVAASATAVGNAAAYTVN